MSDELSETAGGATRALLGAIGFILILLGGELFVNQPERLRLAIGLIAVGALVFFAAFFWKWVQRKLAIGFAAKLNRLAADPMWWVALVSVATSYSLNQFGIASTLAFLAFLGICYAFFEWPKVAKPVERTSSSVVDTELHDQNNAQAKRDLLHLLNFGLHQATLVMLNGLVDRTPPIYSGDIHASMPLNLANEQAHNDAQAYLQLVRNRIGHGSNRAATYDSWMRQAEGEAERILRSTALKERPQGIDPLVLREYAISFRQAVFTAAFLGSEKQQIEDAIVNRRSTLIERFELRNK